MFNFKKQSESLTLLGVTPFVRKDLCDNLLNIDNLSGEEFECFLCDLFSLGGYKVQKNSRPNEPDGGIDIILEKCGTKIAVQAKHYKLKGTNTVKIQDVRSFAGAINNKNIKFGAFITTHYFTPQTLSEFRNSNIEFIDRKHLFSLIGSIYPQLLADAYYEKEVISENIPRCEKCGSVKIKKYNKNTKQCFWGCVRYPECK